MSREIPDLVEDLIDLVSKRPKFGVADLPTTALAQAIHNAGQVHVHPTFQVDWEELKSHRQSDYLKEAFRLKKSLVKIGVLKGVEE